MGALPGSAFCGWGRDCIWTNPLNRRESPAEAPRRVAAFVAAQPSPAEARA